MSYDDIQELKEFYEGIHNNYRFIRVKTSFGHEMPPHTLLGFFLYKSGTYNIHVPLKLHRSDPSFCCRL